LKDAQEETRKAENRASASRFDALTKLHSRSQFLERLDESISLASREGKEVALLLMDLNRFRDVNETLGHRIGDLLLEEVAGRVRLIFRTSDLVARFGDDEFAVLLQTGAATKGAVTAAGKLLQAMQEPFMLEDHHFLIGTSIGIANYPKHGLDGSTVLRHAELAMRAAKRDANGFVVYSGQGESDNVDQLSLAHDLSTAIEQDQLVLNYQPVINMNSGRICGVESLLRWAHPKHGNVPPNVFIPLAEQTGTIDVLTAWVLNKALEQSARWRDQGTDLRVSVNLSPLTLHNADFADTVATALKRWKATPENLVLEITESAIISDAVRATETVERLHDLGVSISIDDFGSGYSSLAHIRKLPVSELKVDKSYVMNMTTEQDDLVIVRTLVELGHNLGLKVVGEGIEDAETWRLLSELGCDFGQGFHMARPMDAAALEKWLHESPWGVGQEPLRRAAQ
jgi:diguanylate cyclase (GGDEF)-like protein